MKDQEVCYESNEGSQGLQILQTQSEKGYRQCLTRGLMQPSLLSQSNVEVRRVGCLTLSYDATHTLHGKAACGPAQRCEQAAGLRPSPECRGIVVPAGVHLVIILNRLHRSVTV